MMKQGYGVYAVWLNWTMSAVALMVALAFTQLVGKGSYPLVCLVMCILLYVAVKGNRSSSRPTCFLMPFIMSRAMFVSAVIMFVINLLHRKHYIDLLVADVELINPEIPYIASLILFPVTAALCAWALLRKDKLPFCAECIRQFGTVTERGFMGEFLSREGRYQARLMFWLTASMSVVDWVYYAIWYVNTNLNSPDLFLFDIGPLLIFGASIIFMTVRCLGVWQFFRLNFGGDNSKFGRTTTLRFIIISEEQLLLEIPEITPDTEISSLFIDTPVTLQLRRKEDITEDDARARFANYTGLEDFKLRFLYKNHAANSETYLYHFLVVLPSMGSIEGSRLRGDWFTLPDVNRLIQEHSLAPLMVSELGRLHAMTMAWKVYDENGLRRYAIRNYKPQFRFSDLANREIDYGDYRKWLYIASNNEDSRFFRLRRFWSRYVSGSAHREKKTHKQ